MTQTSQFERERAKRLCAALMSSRQGRALSTYYKGIGDMPLSKFWYQQAERIDREWAEFLSERLAKLVKPEKEGAIQ
jgi:hypothetical protein